MIVRLVVYCNSLLFFRNMDIRLPLVNFPYLPLNCSTPERAAMSVSAHRTPRLLRASRRITRPRSAIFGFLPYQRLSKKDNRGEKRRKEEFTQCSRLCKHAMKNFANRNSSIFPRHTPGTATHHPRSTAFRAARSKE